MTQRSASDNLPTEPTLKETALKRFLLIGAALLAGMATAQAQTAAPTSAQNAQLNNLRSLAATCANCHGTNGKAFEGSAVVSLAGMPKDYIVLQMKAFKDGTRPATIMHQLAKGYTDAQIDQIAGYFAAQKK
jgi:cytochrome subunit of sulfide dehydrogenase